MSRPGGKERLRSRAPSVARNTAAFTLLEVMIALALFFMCVFAILGVVSRSLTQARNLEPMQVDATPAFALLSLTNRLEEGPIPMEIVRNFEEMFPGNTISGDIIEVATNGLYQIDFFVGGVTETKKAVISQQSVLLFRPMSGGRRTSQEMRR
jgi:hypothetical protein